MAADHAPPPISSVLETVLYAGDPPGCAAWYASVLGLRPLREPGESAAVLRVSESAVLLIFNPAYSMKTGRGVPAHGSTGAGHLAFRVADLDAWHDRLAELGEAIEQDAAWSPPHFRAGRSIYLRDPAGNSVELIDADIWPE